ncbi:MAG TPA: hypothetical protein VM600_10335 [Actinomycetota bacterium]|nr:hypothetical protein [Actinomycetota bacterium]
MNATRSLNPFDARTKHTWHPCRRAASWSLASASTVTASASTALTSQNAMSGLLPLSREHRRADKPGRSLRAMGPPTQKNSIRCGIDS